MKDWQDIVWKLLFGIVIIFFGGWILGGVFNLVAMASPRMASVVFCPAGSTATSDSRPGQIICHDAKGESVPALSEAASVAIQRKYFYTPGVIAMLILTLGWFLWPTIQRMRRKQANG